MQIVSTFAIVPEKETPGCHRYSCIGGDSGVTTLYLRKDALKGEPAPRQIQLVLTPVN